MKRRMIIVFFAAVLVCGGLIHPVKSEAGIHINIAIPLPGLVIPVPPALVVIPGTYAYVAPDVESDLFFYQGYWYRPYQGGWYASAEYNGPWGRVSIRNVPSPLIGLRPGFRNAAPGYERMPYTVVKRNWRRWENDRYWGGTERRDERGMARGHGRGM
jgi:hypothetical protein